MAALSFAGRGMDQRGPPLNTLAVAAACLAAADPLSVADPAFVLTFGATLAILIVVPVANLENVGNPGNLGNLENLGNPGNPENPPNPANLGNPGNLGSCALRTHFVRRLVPVLSAM